ncbi:phage tail termination protein [Phaeacidiphilus oryzae]|uniref:phage tail termination protein n=1 Tax=Phaeacidiphilus oryzae TaxID=348818 RepID=UPI00055A3000|nr:hypothetical protein [Phaeacidiphilus oryzae]
MGAAVGSVDVEELLIAWLGEQLGTGVVVTTELGNDLADQLPTIQVTRTTGTDDGFRLDRAVVDIDAYAADRVAASNLAARIHGLMHTVLRGSTQPTAVVGSVVTVSSPSWRPYTNTLVRRVGATYAIHLHPVS